jgi:phosphatidylethanolamine-binding protein (PEBP) family uncharacterized protein
MKLWSDSFDDGGRIPDECAFAVIDPAHRVRLSSNRNPHLEWSDVPHGTKSFVVICHDRDVPSRPDDGSISITGSWWTSRRGRRRSTRAPIQAA